LDWRTKEVKIRGKVVHLSRLEYELLAALVRRRGWLVSHDTLVSDVWGPTHVGERANLKLYVWYLRRKIEDDPSSPRRIITRCGMGYMFAASPAETTSESSVSGKSDLR